MPLHRRLPKRGFKNTMFALKLNEVNLGRIQEAIDAGRLDAAAKIDAAALIKAGILRRAKAGVRLLGAGEIKAKVALSVYGASKSAIAAVEKAGGTPPRRRQASRRPDPYIVRVANSLGTRSFGGWSRQQNNWQPILTSGRWPKPKS
jgi:hypothetical protein